MKMLLERVDDSAKWVEQKRRNVQFAPGKAGEVGKWEKELRAQLESASAAPLSKYLKVLNKARENRRKLLEKVRLSPLSLDFFLHFGLLLPYPSFLVFGFFDFWVYLVPLWS